MHPLRFPEIRKVILFGGAPLLVAAAQLFRAAAMEVRVYTSPRHEVEALDAAGTTLGVSLKRLGIPYVVTNDINKEASLRREIDPHTLGLGLGEAWSFSAEIIDAFDGRLLDFMGIPHPEYRGGAHYTWMILRDDRDGGAALQVVNEDTRQGEFDSGAIVAETRFKFPRAARIPADYFAAAVKAEIRFLERFLDDVRKKKDFRLLPPREEHSLFFPRLNTKLHGWIDWSWTGLEIERIICAFDDPYAGASTRLGDQRIHLKGAVFQKTVKPFHPFQAGLVTRVTKREGYVIVVRGGLLRVRWIGPPAGGRLTHAPVPGDRLFTPMEDLASARSTRLSYGTKP